VTTIFMSPAYHRVPTACRRVNLYQD